MEKDNKPAYSQKLGAIRLSIWENVTENGVAWHNTAITRSYKEGDSWREATTFNGLGDLAQVAAAVGMAQEWIKSRQDQRAIQEDTAY
jgi:hypothetical protein